REGVELALPREGPPEREHAGERRRDEDHSRRDLTAVGRIEVERERRDEHHQSGEEGRGGEDLLGAPLDSEVFRSDEAGRTEEVHEACSSLPRWSESVSCETARAKAPSCVTSTTMAPRARSSSMIRSSR